jgi:hypothetical protein
MHGSSARCDKGRLGFASGAAGGEEGVMTDVMRDSRVTLIAAAILGLGIIIGGYLLGDGLRRARMADRAVTMRGLAERDVVADLAT